MYLGKANQLNTALAVNATGTGYSNFFVIGFGVSFSLQYQATSSGVVAVRIVLEESFKKLDGSTGLVEGQSSTFYVVPDLQPDVVTLTVNDNNWHIRGFSPTEAKYGRFKCIGQSGNDASTTLNLVLMVTEPGRTYGG